MRLLASLLALLALSGLAEAGKGLRTATKLATASSKAGDLVIDGDRFAHHLTANTISARDRVRETGVTGGYTRRQFVDFGKGKVRYDHTRGVVAHGGGVMYEASTGLLAQERRDGSWTVQKNTKGQFGKSLTVSHDVAADMVHGLIPFQK